MLTKKYGHQNSWTGISRDQKQDNDKKQATLVDEAWAACQTSTSRYIEGNTPGKYSGEYNTSIRNTN